MKKFLFTAAMMIGALVSGQAAELQFGYCSDICDNNVGGNNAGAWIGAAIELPAETLAKFKGNKITGINIGFGECKSREVTVFLSNDLYEKPVYEQAGVCAKQDEWNIVKFDTPYVIDGEQSLYVGYYLRMFTDLDYPLTIDGNKEGYSEYGDMIALSSTKGALFESFTHMGDRFGNVRIRVLIEGDNLPVNDANPLSIKVPEYLRPGQQFSGELMIYNQGSNDLNDIDVTFSVGGTDFDRHIVFDEPLAPSQNTTVTIDDLKCDVEDLAVEYAVTVTKTNGVENLSADNVLRGKLTCSSVAFNRAVVVEEGTGTWCSNCPRGIVGMQYMEENYGDKGFIGIAVHNGDPMSTPTYSSVESMFFPQLPMCTVNRTISCDPSKDTLVGAYDIMRTFAFAKVSMTIDYQGEHPEYIKVKAVTEFAMDYSDIDYALAFVLTENNVGPYPQQNNYCTGKLGPLDGVPDKPLYECMYNEVARYILGWNGIPESAITSATAGQQFKFEADVPAKTVGKIQDMSVIALLLDRKTATYEIVNACKVNPGKFESEVDGDR